MSVDMEIEIEEVALGAWLLVFWVWFGWEEDTKGSWIGGGRLAEVGVAKLNG